MFHVRRACCLVFFLRFSPREVNFEIVRDPWVRDEHETKVVFVSPLDTMDDLEHLPTEHRSLAAVPYGQLPEGLLIANQFDHGGLDELLAHLVNCNLF